MRYLGIDGCKAGWVVWLLNGGSPSFQIVTSLSDIADVLTQSRALIDIPIGFSDSAQPDRLCDKAARKFLAPKRGSSVFPVPCKEAAYAETYQQACQINMEQLGKKLSKQTWYILPKVREVDALLRQEPSVTLRESHPEVVFKALNKQPLSHSKKTIEGRAERLAILNRYCPEWISVLTDSIEQTKRSMAQPDDLIDAFALMFIASKWPQLSTLPETKAPLANEIVYWQAN
ncbi:hypothetical protein AKJ18_14685 [Vibrio xuii]|nr:hypothetical protein AKJ18_14685 [Vibrio xuii]